MANTVLRHELKYYISRGGAEIIKSRLKKIAQPDPHADGFKPYFIRSLYFDDMDYKAYRDKINGVEERTKYRIRFYNLDPSFVSLEKKEKKGEYIEKTSVRIDMPTAKYMASGGLTGADSGLLREFDILSKNRLLKPLVLVDYDRTVFAYPIGNVRITVDENVRGRMFSGDLSDTAPGYPALDKTEAVLEVKFDFLLPPQIECLLRDIPKSRSAVSKYCLCCAAM